MISLTLWLSVCVMSLVMYSKSWATLALLSQSLDWLAQLISQLTDPSGGGSSSLETKRRGMLGGRATGKRATPSGARGGSGRFSATRHAPSSSVSLQDSKTKPKEGSTDDLFHSFRYTIPQLCKNLADQSLMALRLEVFLRIFQNLNEMTSSSYMISQDALEPDSFIVNLNKVLNQLEETVSPILSQAKMKYLFGGGGQLTSSVFIHMLIRSVSLLVNSQPSLNSPENNPK